MSPLPIMIIDDDPGTRETLTDILTDWHYEVSVYARGQEAIRAFAQCPTGVLLIDVNLPDTSGLEILRSAREIDPDVAVVVMTGHASLENAVGAMNQGANAYIVKPFNLEELRAVLKKAFREVRLSQENKRLINRLQLTNRDMELAKKELEQTNANLSSLTQEMEDLLRIVSHDLKSPLINIQGFSTRLESDLAAMQKTMQEIIPQMQGRKVQGDLQEWLTRYERVSNESFPFIQKGVLKMDAMIQSLLHLSRIGRPAAPAEENDLNQMLSDIRDLFSHQLEQQKIEWVCAPLPWIHCRANEINQVFANLIGNAINYMGDKTVKRIEITCVPQDGYFQFSVKDSGIGIEEKDFEEIFRVFARVGEVPIPGEGIGLTIVRKIIHGHGGKIWVESQKGKGSTFFFTLPRGKNETS